MKASKVDRIRRGTDLVWLESARSVKVISGNAVKKTCPCGWLERKLSIRGWLTADLGVVHVAHTILLHDQEKQTEARG